MNIAGIIIAGGHGARLGLGEKPLARFANTTLLDAVIRRVQGQAKPIALNVRSDAMPAYGRFRSQGLSLIPDAYCGTIGPLGGVVAGLEWAERLGSEFVWLATFPADTPFLPLDLVATLARAARHNAAPIVASDGERTHSLCALWPITCAERLRRALAPGEMRSVRQVLAALDGAECVIPRPQAFLNINTLEDLVEAEALMREREKTRERD